MISKQLGGYDLEIAMGIDASRAIMRTRIRMPAREEGCARRRCILCAELSSFYFAFAVAFCASMDYRRQMKTAKKGSVRLARQIVNLLANGFTAEFCREMVSRNCSVWAIVRAFRGVTQ